jgi:hypothetical protein
MTELHPSQGGLLGALVLAVVKRLGGDTAVVDEDDNLFRTGWRMARAGGVALIEKRSGLIGQNPNVGLR